MFRKESDLMNYNIEFMRIVFWNWKKVIELEIILNFF